jgi:benzodiazapine receptor
MMNKDVVRQWLVVAAVLVTIIVNALANILPLNGISTGEISDKFQVYFVPAGYVFSIWGLIYLGLVAFAIYQALPAQRENPRLRAIGWPFLVSCAANIAWLFLWHYQQFLWTILAMVILLASLIVIYLLMMRGGDAVPPAERWLVRLPFSIYLGWISVATIANASDVLYYIKWNGWGIAPAVWAVIMMVIAACLAWAMAVLRGDWAYGLVIIWALVGIAVKQASTPLVANTALILAGACAAVVVLGPILRGRRRA